MVRRKRARQTAAPSVCILGPKHRMTQQKLLSVRIPLGDMARKLSERLGYGHA